MKSLNCPTLHKKKQLHLLRRAVHPRSRRQERRRRSQVRIQTTKIRLGHLSRMNAASSNFNPNNPVNLPMQSDSEEQLLPHVPTSSGTGSSHRTMQYTDREEDESEAVPRDIEGNPAFLGRVKGTFKPSNRCGFSHQKYTNKDHDRLCKNMTDDDRALLVLYSSKQESLKASSTSTLIGKKRKEATATETKAYQNANLGLTMKCSTKSTHGRFRSGTGSRSLGSYPEARQRMELREDESPMGPPRF